MGITYVKIPAPVAGSLTICNYNIKYNGKGFTDPGISAWSADRNLGIKDVSNLALAFYHD